IESVSEEVERIRIATDTEGVVLKTDALGSLEAIAESLKRNSVPIRLADVGDVSKRDVMEAVVVKEHEPFYGAILAFNVKALQDAREEATDREIRIFQHNIIYHLIEDYLEWMKSEKEALLKEEFDRLVKPGKIKLLPGYVFRKAKPAIVGVEVIAGHIKPKYSLVKEDGEDVGQIKQIQDRGEAIGEAETGMQVAVSLEKPVFGRHIHEKDIFYVRMPEAHAKVLLERFQNRLSPEELETLKEFVDMMRRKVSFWAA
ncbi:MAG: translation initiation factor IF-2, partial [Candidatus Bathyarchaeota archaeon]